MKLVLVEWEDSCELSGWHVLSDNDCISNCISAGLLCSEDEKQVVIAQSRSCTGSIGDTISIPKGCITRIRYLKVEKEV